MLKYLKSLSLVAVIAAGSAVAHASSVPYDLNATSAAGTLTGTVNIDPVTKLVTSATVALNGSSVFSSISSESTANGIGRAFLSTSGLTPQDGAGELALYYDLSDFGTGVLSLCVRGTDCQGNVASYVHLLGPDGTQGPVYLTSGELDVNVTPQDSPVPTPEPPSLILLGTGIFFGAILMARFSRRSLEKA